MDPLPTGRQIDADTAAAAAAINASEEARRQLRRCTRRHDPERQALITRRVNALRRNAAVLRSHLKRSDYHPTAYSAARRRRIKRLLREMRYQRRQIKKMLPP